nr:small, acid-soluble spore protein, alpha/beta type [Syntrophomonas palmitatica]
MAKRRSIMSEQLKYEIARELGVDQVVATQGWGAVSSRDCGNMVAKAIEIAERNIAQQNQAIL